MRITGGEYRGRTLRTPKGGVRPTQDMVRQALFNMLMTRIEGARVLDLYAGSGAVGLEAISRGAESATWVERDRKTLSSLRSNAATVVQESGRIVCDDVIRFLKRSGHSQPYDIIFADPPYTDARKGERDPLNTLLSLIDEGEMLATDGIFLYESAGGKRAAIQEPPPGWHIVVDREYGRTRIRAFAKGSS